MKRRNFVRTLLGGAFYPMLGCESAPVVQDLTDVSFQHGVASGDPLSDRVILWTRVSGLSDQTVDVRWHIASDRDMRSVLQRGTFRTDATRDYTVKVDANKLPPGQTFYYQFELAGERSPIGRTRTLPKGSPQSAAFAVVSCSNHPYGYFHVYREIALRDNLAAVIHLGDYIYEYGMGEYATEHAEALSRLPEPSHRLVRLEDYRKRHAQYKADADSQAMHASHPLIAVWDDHELANDAWREGAENHREDDGAWSERRDAAIQAWLEWMPVRVAHRAQSTRIYRHYEYGDLLSLIMLDTRLYGRDRQPDSGASVTKGSVSEALRDAKRRLLGTEQESWLKRTLRQSSGTIWQLIGQQVMVSPTRSPELGPLLDLERESMLPKERLQAYIEQSKGNPPMLLDTWNGYPAAREDFLADLRDYAENPLVLSGDLHTSLAGDLLPDGASSPVAVEFMTTSVTSPGFAEYLPETHPGAVRDATLALNTSLRYMETDRRGWLWLKLDRQRCVAEWHLVDNVHEPSYSTDIDVRLYVVAGKISDGLQKQH